MGALIVLAVFLAAAAPIPPAPSVPPVIGIGESKQTNQNKPAEKPTIASTEAPKSEYEPTQDYLGYALAVLAALIALFTYLAIRRQANIMDGTLTQMKTDASTRAAETASQLRLARDEFIATHRPRIIARRFEPIFGEFLEIQFAIINKGESIAKTIKWKATVYLLDAIGAIHGTAILPSETYVYAEPLEVGQGQLFSFKESAAFDPTDLILIENGQKVLHVLGYVQYRDDVGVSRVTGFFRYYDPRYRRFRAVDDPDWEYPD